MDRRTGTQNPSGIRRHIPVVRAMWARIVLSGQDRKMKIEVIVATDDDRPIVRRLLQLYHYDFSEFDGADVMKDSVSSRHP
jgi:hypothetical protein